MKFETSCVHATVNSNEWIELDLCHMIMSMSFLFNLVDQLQICLCRYTPSMPRRQLFGDVQRDRFFESDHIYEHGDASSSSNFVDLDWLSSSGNSCEEEPYERYFFIELAQFKSFALKFWEVSCY